MNALELHALTKIYGNGHCALKGIDLSVADGDFFALLGPNGAGKSTMIGIITSLVNKSGGCVRVYGIDIDEDFAAAKSLLGVVPQEFNFSQFETVWEIVVNQAGFYGLPRDRAEAQAEKYLRRLGLWDRRKDRSRTLSGGMKRRLMIARALVHEPRLLILDEPTAGVDIEVRRSMWDFLADLNRGGTTVILTTHYLEEAERLCRNIAIIDRGLIIENTTMKDLLAKLHAETFVLDIGSPVADAPTHPDFAISLLDPTTLEAIVDRRYSLNDLFSFLSAQGISVVSMRNKANRLEELFVNMVQDGTRASGAGH
ncbi:MAG TPA: ABC transporter ATP-binding protein [Gammaproteobacteria bacterium]|nr:ABC transporter ATP-binding protein [Gammaproteobacteria bacterium]